MFIQSKLLQCIVSVVEKLGTKQRKQEATKDDKIGAVKPAFRNFAPGYSIEPNLKGDS